MILGESISMDEYDVKLSEQAAKDMSDIYEYICNEIGMPQTAIEQFNRIADAVESLSVFPERIRVMSNEFCRVRKLRQLLIDNYSIIFIIRENEVSVVRILYSSSNIEERLQEEE